MPSIALFHSEVPITTYLLVLIIMGTSSLSLVS